MTKTSNQMISDNWSRTSILISFSIASKKILLVLHKYKVENAVEDCIYQVCQCQVEYEKVCDGSHSFVP